MQVFHCWPPRGRVAADARSKRKEKQLLSKHSAFQAGLEQVRRRHGSLLGVGHSDSAKRWQLEARQHPKLIPGTCLVDSSVRPQKLMHLAQAAHKEARCKPQSRAVVYHLTLSQWQMHEPAIAPGQVWPASKCLGGAQQLLYIEAECLHLHTAHLTCSWKDFACGVRGMEGLQRTRPQLQPKIVVQWMHASCQSFN